MQFNYWLSVFCYLQTKRGDNDLHLLQSCMTMADEMDTVFLEDLNAARPHFRAIRNISKISAELLTDYLAGGGQIEFQNVGGTEVYMRGGNTV